MPDNGIFYAAKSGMNAPTKLLRSTQQQITHDTQTNIKTVLAILAAAAATLFCASPAKAITETIALGPGGTYVVKAYDLTALDGDNLAGQTISLDLLFDNSVHVFSNTANFALAIFLKTNSTGPLGFTTGTGYILDQFGLQASPTSALSSTYSDDGQIGVFLSSDIARPFDFYGAHFDWTLPNYPSVSITSGIFDLQSTLLPSSPGFRIGPHVPDSGATALLLLVGLVPLVVMQGRWQAKIAPRAAAWMRSRP